MSQAVFLVRMTDKMFDTYLLEFYVTIQPMFDIQVEEVLRWEKKESGKAGMNKKQAFKTL